MAVLERHIGLVGATAIGVGAIVVGGILVLGGVALAETGPGAIVAFGLNGLIAALTALSFAELSSAFPESGGAYTYAKKVLSVRAAFAVAVVPGDDVAQVVVEQALMQDLVILGVQRLGRRQKVFGEVALRIARDAPCATILISRRG